ncbi:MAG: IS1634 family transposase, partial [Nanoarchaeota archaeon]|nr:IS1634 family transposase [Nanoarchaeota archaeon]
INRSINPQSKSQTARWCKDTALPWLLNIQAKALNSSRVFRELCYIENQKEALCQHLFTLLQKRDPKAMSTVFYDLSSTMFYGSKCVLMKWGHCKEGYENHIVLAIVVNKEGLPFYWEVLPGGTADSTTIVWLMDRLQKRFKSACTTVVFDRGMVSDDNLALIETAKIKYISAMDKNQVEKITGIDFSQFSKIDTNQIASCGEHLSGFTKLNKATYYRDIKVHYKRRYILCFNPELFVEQRKALEKHIVDFNAFITTLNTEYSEAKGTRRSEVMLKKCNAQLAAKKLSTFIQVTIQRLNVIRTNDAAETHTVSTCFAQTAINEQEKLKAGRLDGFWLLVTNHSEKEHEQFIMTAPDAINPYREKVVIESAFRDIKSFVEIAPVYVWTAEHVKAHFTICVLAYLINRTITLKLHKNTGEKTKDIVAHERFYQALSDCKIDQIQIKNKNMSFYQMTQQNEAQTELLERTALENLLGCKFLKRLNEISIAH